MPCGFIVDGRPCRIQTKADVCHIHQRSSKLVKKVVDQKIEICSLNKKLAAQKAELTTLNKRLSVEIRKLRIIDECDRVKSELLKLSQDCSFRSSITNPLNKDRIEAIFKVPFPICICVYNDLLYKRNILTHRYTSRDWDPMFRVCRNGRSLKQLVGSLDADNI